MMFGEWTKEYDAFIGMSFAKVCEADQRREEEREVMEGISDGRDERERNGSFIEACEEILRAQPEERYGEVDGRGSIEHQARYYARKKLEQCRTYWKSELDRDEKRTDEGNKEIEENPDIHPGNDQNFQINSFQEDNRLKEVEMSELDKEMKGNQLGIQNRENNMNNSIPVFDSFIQLQEVDESHKKNFISYS